MYVGEHSCRPSLLCNPVFDKIDNNNNNNVTHAATAPTYTS